MWLREWHHIYATSRWLCYEPTILGSLRAMYSQQLPCESHVHTNGTTKEQLRSLCWRQHGNSPRKKIVSYPRIGAFFSFDTLSSFLVLSLIPGLFQIDYTCPSLRDGVNIDRAHLRQIDFLFLLICRTGIYMIVSIRQFPRQRSRWQMLQYIPCICHFVFKWVNEILQMDNRNETVSI